jgi:pectinesterase
MINIIVDKSGTDGEFKTINDAIASMPEGDEPITLTVYPGESRERVNLKRKNVTLKGMGPGEVKIVYGEYALKIHEDGRKTGTFRTATFMADCDNFTAENITFVNDAGQGSKVGQAIALYADGRNQRYINCRMKGYQDTVFTAPLPPSAIQIDGFLGEKQFMERRSADMEFIDCRIEGNIDYIFGSAKAVFTGCTLFTRKRDTEGKCFVTAASTPEGQKTGYVFRNCHFLTDAPAGTVYLGRPWRDFAKTEIINSFMDEGIAPEGWDDWNKPSAWKTICYSEKNCYGPGASKNRAPFVTVE